MKLKTKIILAVGFFFILLLLIAGAALYLQHQVKQSTALVLKDNYESLQYSHRMLAQLNEWSDTAVYTFEQQLRLQEQNITEPGEHTVTHQLRQHFNSWQQQPSDSLTSLLRQSLQRIIQLNMDAIERKNKLAVNQAKNTTDGITLLCAVVFLIGLSFLFSFPALLLQPADELAQLGRSFNEMARLLDEYENSNLARIRFEKDRAEAVVNSLKDASLGVDQSGRILFANEQALELLHLSYQQVVGSQLSQLCKQNDLLASMVNDEQSVPLKIVVAGREEYFVREKTPIEKDGEPLGTVYSLHNITNFQQRDTAKTNLIATISHELKTPVASIKMGINVLANTPGAVAEEERAVLTGMQ
ncbi:MAG: cell wall metabolism sensor histidine kinase WalK, partial [Chitinophagaceae bacterium]|nr:cell wall metabolism sensor histidine kinase WalK [Chitinophagaceae bacterium]